MKTASKKIIQRPSQKNGRWIGKWVETKTRTPIIVCICGNKYIKSREGQLLCLKCSAKVAVKTIK